MNLNMSDKDRKKVDVFIPFDVQLVVHKEENKSYIRSESNEGFPVNYKIPVDGNLLDISILSDSSKVSFKLNETLYKNSTKRQLKKTEAVLMTIASSFKDHLQGFIKEFRKDFVLKGNNYKAEINGNSIKLYLGYSHSFDFELPPEITLVEMPKTKGRNFRMTSKDKSLLSKWAADFKRLRKPNNYSGQGIFFKGEEDSLVLKPGKRR